MPASGRFARFLRGEIPDNRPAVVKLHRRLIAALPQLEALYKRWVILDYEDRVYRLYHGSYKVLYLQEGVKDIVCVLRKIGGGRKIEPLFLKVVDPAETADNSRRTVEAFLHAKYFLEMAIKYGKEMKRPMTLLPSGWAAILELYGLR